MACILGIETSCDETGVAVYCGERGLIAQALYSQIKSHAEFGGVVPEIASRDHVRKIVPLIRQCLRDAKMEFSEIDAIAYTAGPGLIGALMVGANVANALAWSLQRPCIPVHHMEGHLLAPLMEPEQAVDFPFLGLLVSGGHTLLVVAHALGKYEIIGQSLDDAVGEAFDKTAKILSLGYPGGPAIEQQALRAPAVENTFPRPMLDRPGFDFSFSGLKTHALLAYQRSSQSELDRIQVAAEFQAAIVDTMVEKCKRALQHHQLQTLVVSGGVSANQAIRSGLQQMAQSLDASVHFPSLQLCTDNGAMIAFAGYLHRNDGVIDGYHAKVKPRWPIDQWRAIREDAITAAVQINGSQHTFC